jgi:hypothetical protein
MFMEENKPVTIHTIPRDKKSQNIFVVSLFSELSKSWAGERGERPGRPRTWTASGLLTALKLEEG